MAENTRVPASPYEVLQQSPIDARCRLTLTSGQPVMSSTVNNASQLIVTPYLGAVIPVYNPQQGTWAGMPFAEAQINLVNGSGAQQVTTNSNYDVYAFFNTSNGLPAFALSPAWSGDTTIGTNPGSAERTTVAGLAVNRWDIAGGPAAQRGTVLGSIRTNSASQLDYQFGSVAASSGPAFFGVSNMFNRKLVSGKIADLSSTWTWTSASYRPVNGQSTNARASAIFCTGEDAAELYYAIRGAPTNASAPAVAFALDVAALANSTPAGLNVIGDFTAATRSIPQAIYCESPGIGFHFWVAQEASGNAGTTVTFLGAQTSQAAPPQWQPGVRYSFFL